MSDADLTKKLHSTMDAKVWANEWCWIARSIEASDDERAVIDEGWMIGWFANAIMAGYDHGLKKGREPEPDAELYDGSPVHHDSYRRGYDNGFADGVARGLEE